LVEFSKIIVLCKNSLERLPLAVTTIRILCDLGKDVVCVCSACHPETEADLRRIGVLVIKVYPEDPRPSHLCGKLIHYAYFRKRAWRIIESENSDALLWVIRADTAMALGRRLWKKQYILTIKELYDRNYPYQKAIGLYAPKALAVVVPEFCRASILRCWHRLNKTPFVLPNKPLVEAKERNLPVSAPAAATLLGSIPRSKKILLYQGALDRDRNIEPVAEAAHKLERDYSLVIMGEDRAGGWVDFAVFVLILCIFLGLFLRSILQSQVTRTLASSSTNSMR